MLVLHKIPNMFNNNFSFFPGLLRRMAPTLETGRIRSSSRSPRLSHGPRRYTTGMGGEKYALHFIAFIELTHDCLEQCWHCTALVFIAVFRLETVIRSGNSLCTFRVYLLRMATSQVKESY